MVLIDGHVHVYDCYSVAAVFDAAAANFAAAAPRLAGVRGYDAVLCLVEGANERFFDGVRSGEKGRVWRGRHGYWEAGPCSEPESFVVRCGGTRLAVIAGRQLITRERLEVLAVGTTAPLRDGDPIDSTLAAVHETRAAAVLPWGVGKWLGRRGAVVARILADQQWRHVLVGDNGNRLAFGPEPAQLAAARRAGRCVLPGSDPLPLRGQEARVGSYGCAVKTELDWLRPAAALLAILKSGATFAAFGRKAELTRFVGSQLALKLRSA